MGGAMLDVLALYAFTSAGLFSCTFSSHFFIPPSLFLLVGDCLLRTLARAGVGLGALTSDGQALAMTHAAVNYLYEIHYY